MVLSGAVGNNSFTLANTAARDYGFGNIGGNVAVVGLIVIEAGCVGGVPYVISSNSIVQPTVAATVTTDAGRLKFVFNVPDI